MYVGLVLVGVMFADTIKPMIQKLPVIGGLFGAKSETK